MNNKLTDERLRHHLDANQVGRERLCRSILPLLGDYRFVRPRYPRGGPDGGRDMECVYAGSTRTWCAVGFKNAANDSNEQVKEIQKKFRDDADSARENAADLTGFVFMTNVHLTDSDKAPLQEHAKGKGFAHCEIFTREDLVGALDSIAGFPFRLKFLDIEMSKEDQVAFVSAYQQQLRDIVTKQHRSVEARLEKLEFLQWSLEPLNEIGLLLHFKDPVNVKDLGSFRICAQIVEVKKGDLNTIAMYVQNGSRPRPQGDGDDYGYITRLPANGAEIVEEREEFSRVNDQAQLQIAAGIMQFEAPPAVTLMDLHRRDFHLHATENIATRLIGVTLIINSYAVLQARGDAMSVTDDLTFEPLWYEELDEAEKGRWREIEFIKLMEMFDWQRNPPMPLF